MRLLITGATGFIGKHVVRQALIDGHTVRATLRDLSRSDELRAAVGNGPLETVTLDLLRDDGWAEAMTGIDGVLHTASPVPVGNSQSGGDVIRTAVEGTRRAVGAAAEAGVPKVVVTSSIAAMLGARPQPTDGVWGPNHWTDIDAPAAGAYAVSKTLAEHAAREIAANTPTMSLSTVNPGFVFGAPLDHHWASSLVLVDRLLKGRDPMLPRLSFPSVTVEDVAEAHLAALDAPDGSRIVASGKTLWMADLAAIIREAVPSAKASRWSAPDWLVRFMGRFDPAIRGFASNLGKDRQTDCATLTALLGRDPTPPEEGVAAAARALAAQSGRH